MGQRRPLIDLVKALRVGEQARIDEALLAAEKVLSRTPDSRACQFFHLPSGYSLMRQLNDVGGYQYWSDEIGGGVLVWDTCLVDDRTLRAAILIEQCYGLPAPPMRALPDDKLLSGKSYLAWDRRVPGWVVGMWTDRWIMIDRRMVFDTKAQAAARESLVPCLELGEEPEE